MERMSDLLDTVRRDIDSRLEELRPRVEEAARLQGAFDALARINGQAATEGSPRARVRTPALTSTPRGETRRRIVRYLRANPGSTAGDVAHALGLNRRSTSTRLTQLVKAGEIIKAERGYSAAK
jgi:CRP-like cAMP-binding protein